MTKFWQLSIREMRTKCNVIYAVLYNMLLKHPYLLVYLNNLNVVSGLKSKG